jgi:hypothetical protein
MAPPPPMAQPAPGNNLVMAILVTIFCCLPFGIVGIIKAAEVNGKWAQGDYAGAQASADAARKWSLIGLVIGLVASLAYGIFWVVAIASSNS